MTRLPSANSRLFRSVLKRTSPVATIKRRSNDPTENEYGKVESSDYQYTNVADERVHRIYATTDDRPTEAGVDGGRLDIESPRLAFMDDTAAQEDDRVTFPDTGRTYHLDERVPRKTHVEFRATLVNE